MNPRELSQIIRFHLNQLAASNGFHVFEDLCRFIARARICSNIVPATGPVSAGGDQGRDFETYRTFLARTEGASSFVGLATDQTVAFSCSLQQERIRQKILNDVEKICGVQALSVDHIVYFCEVDLPVGQRHAVQQEVQEQYGVTLDVHDGRAIAELLADPELFWIGQEFLSLPAAAFPPAPSDEEDDWYLSRRSSWGDRQEPALTFGDLQDITSALRHAYQSGRYVADVPFWLHLLASVYADPDCPGPLRRHALYEAAVASLRGLGTLEPYTEDLESYFEAITDVVASGKLEDAAVLLVYCFGAAVREEVLGPALADVLRWRAQLEAHLDQELSITDNPARKCSLLFALGYAKQAIDPTQTSLDEAFQDVAETWLTALNYADEAKLFPVEHLADLLAMVAPMFAGHAAYRPLVARVDELVAERAGESAVAAKCRDRAMALLNADRYALALEEFHAAKAGWLSGDTIRGSLLAMLLIGRCYEELRLLLAAKYYFLATAKLALDSGLEDHFDLASEGVFNAALCDYQAGSWFSYLELAAFGSRLHTIFDVEPWDFSRHTTLQRVGLPAWIVYLLARQHVPEAEEAARTVFQSFGDEESLAEVASDPSSPWHERSLDSICEQVTHDLGCRPFDDASSPERSVVWDALGLRWTIRHLNDYGTRLVAERFIAVTQIILADLAGRDLCLLPTSIEVTVGISTTGDPSADRVPSNDVAMWNVDLSPVPSSSDMDRLHVETLAAVIAVLSEVSLLDQQDLESSIEDAFKRGISHKVSPYMLYDNVLAEFVPPEDYEAEGRLNATPPCPPLTEPMRLPSDLAWIDTPGPGYTRERADEFLANRYRRLTGMTRQTLERLRLTPAFSATVAELRRDGLLDWHILGAINAAALSWRTSLARPTSQAEYEAAQRRWLQDEEDPDGPVVPMTEFTLENLRLMHQGNTMAALKTWGLTLRAETPDVQAVDAFLRARYRHYSDDISHDDPFEEDS